MSRPKRSTALAPLAVQRHESPALAQAKAVGALTGLLEDIAACRAEIVRKEAAAHELEKRLHADLASLESQWINLRVQTFRALGRQLRDGRLSRKAHKTLAQALASLADELAAEYGADLREDRRIYLGEEAGEEDQETWSTGGAGGARGGSGGTRGTGKAEAEGGSREDPEGGKGNGPGTRERGRPERPATQAARRRDAKEQALAGDIRALYLILARALHPDKEANPALREAKTAWMQKVTAAYARKDLAMLLDILARNPLEAVGPYLAEAPVKTVQGFARRLRRELAALREQASRVGEWLHPSFAQFLRNGAIDEARLARHLGDMKRAVRLAKQRLEAYRTPEGAQHLIDGLRVHDWRDLL